MNAMNRTRIRVRESSSLSNPPSSPPPSGPSYKSRQKRTNDSNPSRKPLKPRPQEDNNGINAGTKGKGAENGPRRKRRVVAESTAAPELGDLKASRTRKRTRRGSSSSSSLLSAPPCDPSNSPQSTYSMPHHETVLDFILDYDSADDYLPTLQEILAMPSPEPVKVEEEEEEESEVYVRPFRPTVASYGMDVGSTCYVLKREVYYPAYVTAFEPAMTSEEREKRGDRWTVRDCTGEVLSGRKRSKIKQVLFRDDDEIATCRCVKIGSIVPKKSSRSDADHRPPTPPPQPSSLIPPFQSLNRTDQIRLIRPHLQTVISEVYEPAQWRNDLFYKVSSRNTLSRIGRQGNFDSDELTDWFVPELRRWALRGERKSGHGGRQSHRPKAATLAEPVRPKGSERYEALTTKQREQYILGVLLPETIIQLIIRLENLNTDDGVEPYEKAQDRLTELSEMDEDNAWEVRTMDLKRWRKLKRAQLGLVDEDLTREEKEVLEGKEQGWAGGRMVVRKNYKI